MAILYGTRYDLFRRATGESLIPGSLILEEGGNGTVYVLNYKLEKQPINYAGFMKYYAAPGDNPFINVIHLSPEEISKYPTGALITADTPPAILTAPPSEEKVISGKTEEKVITNTDEQAVTKEGIIPNGNKYGKYLLWAAIIAVALYIFRKKR